MASRLNYILMGALTIVLLISLTLLAGMSTGNKAKKDLENKVAVLIERLKNPETVLKAENQLIKMGEKIKPYLNQYINDPKLSDQIHSYTVDQIKSIIKKIDQAIPEP